MAIWRNAINLAKLNDRGNQTMAAHLGIEFIEIGDDYLVARMPVDQRHKQPLGIMHGGASCVLAETVGSTAANYCVDFDRHYCVGLDINTNHLRPVTEGEVLARAEPYHLGKTTQVWGITISNADGKLVSVSRLTMSVRTREPDSG